MASLLGGDDLGTFQTVISKQLPDDLAHHNGVMTNGGLALFTGEESGNETGRLVLAPLMADGDLSTFSTGSGQFLNASWRRTGGAFAAVGDSVLLIGGEFNGNAPSMCADVQILDDGIPDLDSATASFQLAAPRVWPSVVVTGSYIHVLGGLTPSNQVAPTESTQIPR